MLERVARREIDREAESNIALGLLLRKGRDEQKKHAVKAVLSSGLSVPQKIEKIKQIDQKENELELRQVVRLASAQSARKKVAQISQAIKQPQSRLSFFSFLLGEYGKIRDFGRETHALLTRIWPPGVRVDPDLQSFFVEQLQSWAMELSPKLKSVTDHGWLYLTPYQYNLIMLLRRLSDRILAFDFVHIDYRDRNLIEKLHRVETLFLMLQYKPEHIDTILSSLQAVFTKQHKEEKEFEAARELVIKVLSPGATSPSLHDALVGLNILKCRRFLTLSDLMRKGLEGMVSSRDFDCDTYVCERMEGYIHESLKSMRTLHEQLIEARRLNGYIGYDEKGNMDSGILSRFYESGEGKEKYAFQADQENLVVFASRFLRRFDRVYSALLNGRVQTDLPERVSVFSRSFFALEFARLRSVIEKLEKGLFLFSRFPLTRYLQNKESQSRAIGTELEANMLIDEATACLVDMGKVLMKILSLARPEAASGDALEPIILQGKPFSLPFADQSIRSRSFLKGKTVTEALSSAVSICFSAGLLFQDRFLYVFLGREKRTQVELRTRMKLLENILDADSLPDLTAQFA